MKLLLLFTLALSGSMVLGFPPEAGRKTPPKEMYKKALRVGKQAPVVQLSGVSGKKKITWSSKGKRNIAYIFYRGAW